MKGLLGRLRRSGRLHELAGLLALVFALISLLSLVSYDARDASRFHRPTPSLSPHNWIGWTGATLAEMLLQLLGAAAFLTPWLAVAAGWWLVRRGRRGALGRLAGHGVLALALCTLLDLLYRPIAYGGERFASGGLVGARAAALLGSLFGTAGALIVTVAAIAAVLVLTTSASVVRSTEALVRLAARGARAVLAALGRVIAARRSRQSAAAARPAAAAPAPSRRPPIAIEPPAAAPVPATLTMPRSSPAAGPSLPKKEARREAVPRQVALPLEPPGRGYTLPPTELLNEPAPQTIESEQELLERARLITEKLREFAVHGSVVAIHPGPVVTTFEFKPDSGIKYSKITSMTEDLSLALKAESVRIDRLPGRSTVGIEVPNRQQETIFPRELFDSERFRASRSKLTLCPGKTVSGEVFTAELDRMPHLLIAGATGSGKSVGLNGMIASILYKATPDEARFLMIDTKMIELGVYAGIPHLLVPVVTQPKQASAALKWAVREMEQRYRKLASQGVRNIAQFNTLIAEEPTRTMDDPAGGPPLPLAVLPYIVIVIDELADLMMVSSADVEESIMRLAQMARAVGIHLIIATQRPSVDVITGTIKANFPSRIAFRVSQRVDSRTIIDQQGAEHLLGRGDMLFLKTGSSRLIRLHGALITEAELARLTTFLKKMAEPVYDESVLAEPEEQPGAVDAEERDEMYVQAVRTVIQERKCSITLIQRRLQLGYARAARIVDVMEREGIVSTGDGAKPRDVLVGPEFLEAG